MGETQIETEIKVCFITTLGDNFPDDMTESEQEELIEQHIKDYCKEHDLDRNDVEIIND